MNTFNTGNRGAAREQRPSSENCRVSRLVMYTVFIDYITLSQKDRTLNGSQLQAAIMSNGFVAITD
jgi:hypothetical protein